MGFLQYILQQEKQSMIHQVLEATKQNPIKNEFVQTCKKYLQVLNINMSFEEIAKLTKYQFKKIVKEKTTIAAFKYLIEKKDKPDKNGKMKRKSCIYYEKLELQHYLLDGNKNINISKFICKALSKTLDLKTHKKWKYKMYTASGVR